jgi:hypothetical protein
MTQDGGLEISDCMIVGAKVSKNPQTAIRNCRFLRPEKAFQRGFFQLEPSDTA